MRPSPRRRGRAMTLTRRMGLVAALAFGGSAALAAPRPATDDIDEAHFNACLQDEAPVEAVSARAQRAAEQDDVHSTPTIFINGQRVENTPMTPAEMDAAIAAATKGGK